MTKLPNSRHCFVCGLENSYGLKLAFYKDGPDKVICNYTVPHYYEGYPGVVHGGIVTSILDEAVGLQFFVTPLVVLPVAWWSIRRIGQLKQLQDSQTRVALSN